MSTTPTPRTDAVEHRDITGLGIVAVDFARQLERELQQATDRVSDLEAQIERDAWAISPAMAQARINQLAADLARVTAERDEFVECINKSESVAERGNLVGEIQRMEAEIKRLEHENDGLERRRQYETDLVCAAVMESNARGVSFGSAELCSRVDEIRALRARVAELECNEREWRDRVNREMRNVTFHLARADKAEQRNAELVAALRQIATDAMDVSPHIETVALNALARAESAACQNATNGGQISSESTTPSKHPDTEREWQTGTPDVPAGAMRRLWCAVLSYNGKVCHSMLCYANGHAMPLADWVDTIPDCCKPIDGDEENVAWYGWYEESCDHCETQWHSSANVIAWIELPKYAARKQGGAT